jgi:hypothetical protein
MRRASTFAQNAGIIAMLSIGKTSQSFLRAITFVFALGGAPGCSQSEDPRVAELLASAAYIADDDATARQRFLPLANDGNANAQHILGVMYYTPFTSQPENPSG